LPTEQAKEITLDISCIIKHSKPQRMNTSKAARGSQNNQDILILPADKGTCNNHERLQ
jgi:hypothetical protein